MLIACSKLLVEKEKRVYNCFIPRQCGRYVCIEQCFAFVVYYNHIVGFENHLTSVLTGRIA